jgi:hypothetical protein
MKTQRKFVADNRASHRRNISVPLPFEEYEEAEMKEMTYENHVVSNRLVPAKTMSMPPFSQAQLHQPMNVNKNQA